MIDTILLIIAGILFIIGCTFFFSFIFDAPPLPSTKKSRQTAINLIKKHDTRNGDIFEIGTGWGGLALMLAKEFPNRNIITYEIAPLPYLFSKILFKIKGIKNLKIYNKNAFKTLKSGATKPSTIVYYLCDCANKKLKEIYEDSNDVLFVCNTYAFKEETNIKPIETVESGDLFSSTIYAYKNHKPEEKQDIKKKFLGML